SRYLHFESAWVLVLTGLVYGIASLLNGHLRRDLVPERGERSLGAHWERLRQYLRRRPPGRDESESYNALQRTTYLLVIFGLFPLVIWTGLALSPSFNAAFPWGVNLLGGRQSARTLHFFVTVALVLFLFVHVAMVALSGFRNRMRGMITGTVAAHQERP